MTRSFSLPRLFAVQDYLVLAYLGLMSLLVAASPGPAQPRVLLRLGLCGAVLIGGAVLSRRATELAEGWRRNIYRLALALTVVESYLMLRDLLPLVRSDTVDGQLLALDYRLFGVEPALWLERFNVVPVVEWFSFFYFSYFFICAAYLVGVLWLSEPSRHTTVFALGSLLVLCIGHLGYLAVPGFGPVAHLQQDFDGPVQGGFFWNCVATTVAAGGAQKDIFPSLHTALPTWFTLYAIYRARFDRRWRVAAAITGFFAANIIVSTMFLRWHYAVDVVAGLSLATLAAYAAPRIAVSEEQWRQARGLASPWHATPAAASGERLAGLPALEVELEAAGER